MLHTNSSAVQVDHMLDDGALWVLMTNERYWRLRRNGRTKTWKRDNRYRVPVKAGLKVYTAITESDVIGVAGTGHNFVCCYGDANTVR